VTSGGASVGEHDLVRAGLAIHGFVPSFWKIAIRPGKPVIFGLVGKMPVLGMSGNPVSALVSALMFVRPAIAAMLGLPAKEPLFEQAVLGSAMPENHIREDYVRARIERGADGRLIAIPFPSQDSAMLSTLAQGGLVLAHFWQCGRSIFRCATQPRTTPSEPSILGNEADSARSFEMFAQLFSVVPRLEGADLHCIRHTALALVLDHALSAESHFYIFFKLEAPGTA